MKKQNNKVKEKQNLQEKQVKQELKAFVEQAIKDGGFFYYLTEGGVRFYNRFEDGKKGRELKGQMQKCCFHKDPLLISLYGERTLSLLWNISLGRLMVLSKDELLRMKRKQFEKEREEDQPTKKFKRKRHSKRWRVASPTSNFDIISSSPYSGRWLVYHHNGGR